MWICNSAWEQIEVLENRRQAIFVPLYKGKANRDCNSYWERIYSVGVLGKGGDVWIKFFQL